jgi:hypothetical protein
MRGLFIFIHSCFSGRLEIPWGLPTPVDSGRKVIIASGNSRP